ncbi:hypothetical protein B0J12DRAFT_790215, partial [Macrophomina phaseolina]
MLLPSPNTTASATSGLCLTRPSIGSGNTFSPLISVSRSFKRVRYFHQAGLSGWRVKRSRVRYELGGASQLVGPQEGSGSRATHSKTSRAISSTRTCGAKWAGYEKGDIQWRVPLAMQAPPAMLLMALMFIMPYSPRWLIQRERHEDSLKVLRYLHAHRREEWIVSEYTAMQSQIAFESEMHRRSSYRELFTKRYIRRTLLGCLVINMTKLSDSNIIQAYQTVIYNALGFEGQTVLLISGFYGFMAVIGQVLSLFTLSDFWPRKRTVSNHRPCFSSHASEHSDRLEQILPGFAQLVRVPRRGRIHLPLRVPLLLHLQDCQL